MIPESCGFKSLLCLNFFRHFPKKNIKLISFLHSSFDVRGRSFNKALHWSDPLAFGTRAKFITMSRPSSLNVDAVQLDDEGVYRCRVDFKNSPTRNFQIRLNVVGKTVFFLIHTNNIELLNLCG